MKKLVIALGGNAIIKKGEEETYSNLVNNIKKMCRQISPTLKENQAIITHGNGIEIGFLLLQNELAKSKVPPMPLNILGAESQGLIGYPLEEQLINELRSVKKDIVTIITQTLVDKKDPAFQNPTKFIGPFYSKSQASNLSKKGLIIKKDSNRGYRRVVPSPMPIKIIEFNTIKKLVNQKTLVIAAGGGGIPVIETKKGLQGIEAVIDKDLASECLASSIKADYLIMLTSVPYVYLNFGTKKQQELKKVTLEQIQIYHDKGHFPPGNMGPKVQAAMNFINKNPKGKVIITSPENLNKALNGKAGTIITKK